MKKVILFITIVFFLIHMSVSAAELEISPATVEIDLVGGDSVQVNISINWSGSHSASCELTTNITPDGEGINITYSKNNFTMAPGSENKIIMYVNTSMALMPGIYIITTNVFTETEEQEPSGNGDDTYVPWEDVIPPPGPDVPDEPDDEEPDDDEEIDDEIVDGDDGEEDKDDEPLSIFWILGIILFVIMLLYLINRKKKRMVEKPGEKRK